MQAFFCLLSHQLYPVPRRGGEEPDAVLPGGVIVREVRGGELALGGEDLVLAPALLAVVRVLVEHEALQRDICSF